MNGELFIKSMLFADVVGFSKLPEASYGCFMELFSAGAAKILSAHGAQVPNTRGDALFAVFDSEPSAAHAALALQAWLRRTQWHRRLRQPREKVSIRLRIGLHAGPVRQSYDGILQREAYMGRHTNLAARLEPIADENEIVVSGEFAALATLSGSDDLQFLYVGQKTLPKGAGVIPVYRLTSKSIAR